jgi:hypothetical protein
VATAPGRRNAAAKEKSVNGALLSYVADAVRDIQGRMATKDDLAELAQQVNDVRESHEALKLEAAQARDFINSFKWLRTTLVGALITGAISAAAYAVAPHLLFK